jgi:cytochrome P450
VLAQHQDIQAKLREEVKHLNNPTLDEIEACRYLNNVCREMLRYIPPGAFLDISYIVSVTNRVATVDDTFNGVLIPKDTMIFICPAATNFDETVWGPDIDKFNPDRWDKLPETLSNYSYLTFLQGPRSCIGRRFAEVEMKVLLVALIQRLQFDEVVKGRIVEKKAMITTRPKNGMYLKLGLI